jgi:hypothetical protein
MLKETPMRLLLVCLLPVLLIVPLAACGDIQLTAEEQKQAQTLGERAVELQQEIKDIADEMVAMKESGVIDPVKIIELTTRTVKLASEMAKVKDELQKIIDAATARSGGGFWGWLGNALLTLLYGATGYLAAGRPLRLAGNALLAQLLPAAGKKAKPG